MCGSISGRGKNNTKVIKYRIDMCRSYIFIAPAQHFLIRPRRTSLASKMNASHVTVNGMESGIGEPTSDPGLVCCAHFCTNFLEKEMNQSTPGSLALSGRMSRRIRALNSKSE